MRPKEEVVGPSRDSSDEIFILIIPSGFWPIIVREKVVGKTYSQEKFNCNRPTKYLHLILCNYGPLVNKSWADPFGVVVHQFAPRCQIFFVYGPYAHLESLGLNSGPNSTACGRRSWPSDPVDRWWYKNWAGMHIYLNEFSQGINLNLQTL